MGRTSTKEGGAKKLRVYMVELKIDLPDTPNITFFGSKKAIFEYFGNEALRVTYKTMRNISYLHERPYENTVCRIAEGHVLTDKCPEIVERRSREGREEIKNNGSFAKVES